MKALDGQDISTRPQNYSFDKGLLTGDAKPTFNQTDLDKGICTFNNLNKVMIKHIFPSFAYGKWQCYIRCNMIRPRHMKPCNFINRLQELNTYLGGIPGQVTAFLPTDVVRDIIQHFMPTLWRNKMIE